MSFALTGQLLLALVAGHYGWFQLPVAPLSLMKMTGAATLLVGVVLVNRG
jgi:transporter family-2 protein